MSMKSSPSDCPFCSKDIQKAQFAESGNFSAIYNVAPILPGHSLIIPKQHYTSLMDLTDLQLSEMVLFSRRVVGVLLQIFGSHAFNWTLQEGEEAGQTISHLHIHLIPRSEGDLSSPGEWYPMLRKSQVEVIDSELRDRLTSAQMCKIVTRIKTTIRELDLAT